MKYFVFQQMKVSQPVNKKEIFTRAITPFKKSTNRKNKFSLI